MKKISTIAVLLASFLVSYKAQAQVSIGVSITARIAPPALPVYVQPACPADGYLWTPGYWAYGEEGYYWVPGVWVSPPQPGFLWTPCYWGYSGGVYGWHAGYWGPHVGFYGGVNYGYGYGGSGFYGGRWEGNSFRYNTAVVNVNRTVVRNTYVDKTVIVHNTTVINNRTSYNGGPGGISARPSAQEETAMRDRHVQATAQQQSHQQNAGRDRGQLATVNNGRPNNAAMNRVGGQRFSPQGHSTPAVQHAAVNQHPVASTRPLNASPASRHPSVSNTHPSMANTHPQMNSRPQLSNHPQQQPRENVHPMTSNRPAPHMQQQPHPAPEHHEGGGGGGGHPEGGHHR